jgi:hypothetical protein
MLSAAALSMTWIELNVGTLRARLNTAFPGEFLPPRGRSTFVVEGPLAATQFLINSVIAGEAGTFLLNSVPGQYSDLSTFVERIDDLRLRALALAQQAWLSVDLIDPGAKPEGARRFIGKALAALAPDAAVLVDAGGGRCWLFDETIRGRLASGRWPE